MNPNATIHALLIAGLAASSACAASSGTIRFNGAIYATSCKISGGTPGTNNPNFDVDLGRVNGSDIPYPDTYGDKIPFHIYIGGDDDTNCANDRKVWASYDLTPNVDRFTGALRITYGDARGVQVRLFDKNGDSFNIAFGQQPIRETIKEHKATLSYFAAYQRSEPTLIPGQAFAYAVYTVSYEN